MVYFKRLNTLDHCCSLGVCVSLPKIEGGSNANGKNNPFVVYVLIVGDKSF